jgi:hypothetical protein
MEGVAGSGGFAEGPANRPSRAKPGLPVGQTRPPLGFNRPRLRVGLVLRRTHWRSARTKTVATWSS